MTDGASPQACRANDGDERHYTAVVDLRPVEARQRLVLVEWTLDGLAPGEEVLLITGDEPARLRDHVATHWSPRLEWEDLPHRGAVWRARIRCASTEAR